MRGARFPRGARLLTAADFKRVLKDGRRKRSTSFLAYEIVGATAGPRLGLAASKKAMPRSVDRNRFKRIVRQSFRVATGLPACDVVIVAQAAARTIERAALAAELTDYWKRLTQRWPSSSSP